MTDASAISVFCYMLIFSSGALMVISSVQSAMRLIPRKVYLSIVAIAVAIALAGYFGIPAKSEIQPMPGQGAAHNALIQELS